MAFKSIYFNILLILIIELKLTSSQCLYGLAGSNCDLIDTRYIDIEIGVDLGYNFYSYSFAFDAENCFKLCAQDNNCYGATYGYYYCYFYENGKYSHTKNPIYTSYVYYQQTGLVNQNITLNYYYKLLQTTTAYECFKLCDQDTLCDANSFHISYGCYFYQKNEMVIMSSSNWKTYFKTPEAFTKKSNLRTTSFDKKIIVSTSYGCYSDCRNDSRCVGYNILWSYDAHIANSIECLIYYNSENSTLTNATNWINYDLNECFSYPCENMGSCLDKVGSYNCQCTGIYTGKNCSTILSTTKTSTTATTKTTTRTTTRLSTTRTTTRLSSATSRTTTTTRLSSATTRTTTTTRLSSASTTTRLSSASTTTRLSSATTRTTTTTRLSSATTRTTTRTTTRLTTTTTTTTTTTGLWSCGIQYVLNPLIKIVGGTVAVPNSWPWQVYILVDNSYQCGATLINNNWLVTAAHCIDQASFIDATFGAQNINNVEITATKISVSLIIIHENYIGQRNGFADDIALMKLSKPVTFRKEIVPACLPQQGVNLATVGSSAYITGWGYTFEGGFSSSDLKQAKIPIRPSTDCGSLTDDMLCAGISTPITDTCQGDSGGPLVTQVGNTFYLSGITSNGVGCRGYGVYTKVSNYITWMQNNIAKY